MWSNIEFFRNVSYYYLLTSRTKNVDKSLWIDIFQNNIFRKGKGK